MAGDMKTKVETMKSNAKQTSEMNSPNKTEKSRRKADKDGYLKNLHNRISRRHAAMLIYVSLLVAIILVVILSLAIPRLILVTLLESEGSEGYLVIMVNDSIVQWFNCSTKLGRDILLVLSVFESFDLH